MKKRKYILIFATAFWPLLCPSQNLTGMTGLLNIPSADMQVDGTFCMGVNYLPIVNQPSWGYDTGNYYFNLTFLPFLEIAYKCTLLKIKGRYTNQDRGINFRLRLIRESTYLPAVAVGVNDFYSSTGNNARHYGAAYAVLTKHIETRNIVWGMTSGYGPEKLQNHQLSGFFGGISLTPIRFKPLSLMGEYDGQGLNFGCGLLAFKHFYIFSMAQHLQYYAGGVAYKIHL
jgi:hypothetical protein